MRSMPSRMTVSQGAFFLFLCGHTQGKPGWPKPRASRVGNLFSSMQEET